ncbi:MAG: 2-isopropylmalate synthase [Candidatus Methanomethylophilaceae archaeon]|jgi:2-isopropylmalate synthase
MEKQQTSESAKCWKGMISVSPYNQLILGKKSVKDVMLLDTTLRDGEQSPGIALSSDDKVVMAQTIDEIGVDVMEVGFAASSETEKETVRKIVKIGTQARVCSLARSTHVDVDAVIDSGADYVHTFIATSDIHLKYKLKMTQDEVIARAVDTVEYAKSHGLYVQFSCEDATRTELDYLKKVYKAVEDAGADIINVPDTVGVIIPEAMRYLIGELKKDIRIPIAVHCHNDLGLAVANSFAAVEAGANQIHVCVNGLGERSGNAALDEVATGLFINYGVNKYDLSKLGSVSKVISRHTGYPIAYNKPIVGRNAFAHESGIHVHGVLNNAATYEAFPPEMVGMSRNITIGKLSGAHSVRERLNAMNIDFPESMMPELMANIKELAVGGKDINNIELAVIAENTIWKGRSAECIKLKEFVVVTGKNVTPTATVTVDIDGVRSTCAQTGLGPVDAAINAIRGAVNEKITLEELRLEAITGGSDSLCEVTVMIKNTQNDGNVSAGKAVGLDIVDTSVDAIMEAINRDYSSKRKD